MVDVGGLSSLWEVLPHGMREQSEQAPGSKPVSSTLLCFSSRPQGYRPNSPLWCSIAYMWKRTVTSTSCSRLFYHSNRS